MGNSKRIVKLFVFVFLAIVLTGLSSLNSMAAEKKLLTWGTTVATSGVFPYYVYAGKVLNEKIPDINITVRPTGGGVQNVRMLMKHEIDIGSTTTATTWEVLNGTGPFKGTPYKDLRLLDVIMTNGLQIVVSEESGIKTVYDLEGKKISPGQAGGSIELYVTEILDVLGVHADIRRMTYEDAIESMKDRRIVGIAKMGVPDASIMDIASAIKIRVISFSEADRDKVVNKVIGLAKSPEYPAGIYSGVGAFKTFDNEWCNFVNKDFPEDLAYKIVKTLYENRADFINMDKRCLGERFAPTLLGVKRNYLHPGVIKYFREKGFDIPKDAIPPEMK
ncbi:MAG: TAXI family TRAP transporter solute-binding subunit [Thermodesulfobacteriota bacterium]